MDAHYVLIFTFAAFSMPAANAQLNIVVEGDGIVEYSRENAIP